MRDHAEGTAFYARRAAASQNVVANINSAQDLRPLLADVAAQDGREIQGRLPILLDLAGRSEVDVDVPARCRRGLIDILDHRGRLGGTGGRRDQIVERVLDRPLRLTRAEVNMCRVGTRGDEAAAVAATVSVFFAGS